MRETGYESRRTEIVMRSLFLDYLATDDKYYKYGGRFSLLVGYNIQPIRAQR